MENILITGVAGLLGSHFSRYLLNMGYNVIGIDNLFGGYKDFVDDRVDFYEFDLMNDAFLDYIFQKFKPKYVYHFAAYAAEGLSPFIRNFNYTNNVLCSINVINKCIKYDINKLIFTSSMAVYGNGNTPFNESQIPSPIDPYGIAKYTVEQDLKQAYSQFDLSYNIVRPHNVFGIYQNIWDKYRNVIGIWIRNSIDGLPILIYGDGNQKRAFSDIKYYMKPFCDLMSKEFNNEIFNLGSDVEYKLIDVANIVKKISKEFGKEVKIEHVEARHEVKNAYSDHTKAKKILNFNDETNVEELIRLMFNWALQQPKRDVTIMNYEINKNIYSYWRK